MNIGILVGKLELPLDEGTQKSAVTLAQQLQAQGHTVHLLTREDRMDTDEIGGVPVTGLRVSPAGFTDDRSTVQALDLDVLNVHTASPKMALYVSKLHPETVWTQPSYRPEDHGRWFRLWQYLARQRRVPTSPEVRDRTGVPAEVIPYGTDTTELRCDRPPEMRDDLRLFYIGPPEQRRGFQAALACTRELVAAGMDPELHVAIRQVADHPRKAREGIEEYGLADHTEVHGFIEDLNAVYNEMDIVLNPLLDPEGVTSPPIAALEAMATGRILVASDIPEFRDLITDGEDGLLIDRDDIGQRMADRIQALDQDTVDRISGNARQRIQDGYSMAQTAERYIELVRTEIEH